MPRSIQLTWCRMSKRRSYASRLKMLAKDMEHIVFPTEFSPTTIQTMNIIFLGGPKRGDLSSLLVGNIWSLVSCLRLVI